MKTEQEIVLQKKMIILFSLVIAVLTMGILNLQKSTVLAGTSSDKVTRVYTNYIANEKLFTVKESEVVKKPLGLLQEDEKVEVAKNENAMVENEEQSQEVIPQEIIETEEKEETVSHETEEEKIAVASRGSYVRDTNVPPTEYEKVIQVKATAYCLCQKCCGKTPDHPGYGYTASGLRIIPGTGMKVIAVDTSVVSLGTEVYVEGLNGASNYGYAIAADTGGAIKNNKIDLYMDTHQQALAWGVRNVNLYILKSE